MIKVINLELNMAICKVPKLIAMSHTWFCYLVNCCLDFSPI